MKKFFPSLLLIILIFSCSGNSESPSQSKLDTTTPTIEHTDETKLIIIHDTEYVPYYKTIISENKTINRNGPLFAILTESAKGIKLKMEFKHVPGWARCLQLVISGKEQAFFPLFKTPEREEKLYFFDEAIIAYEKNCLISLRSHNLEFDGNLRSIKDYTIGVLPGYSYGSKFDNADYLIKINSNSKGYEKNLLKLLISGKRYEFIIGNYIVMKHYAEELGISDQLVFHKPFLSNDPLYIAFSKKSMDLEKAKKYAESISKFKKTAKYQNIIQEIK